MFVTVIWRKGYEIQINLDGRYYRIKHPTFEGHKFNLVQDAVDAIDKLTA